MKYTLPAQYIMNDDSISFKEIISFIVRNSEYLLGIYTEELLCVNKLIKFNEDKCYI